MGEGAILGRGLAGTSRIFDHQGTENSHGVGGHFEL